MFGLIWFLIIFSSSTTLLPSGEKYKGKHLLKKRHRKKQLCCASASTKWFSIATGNKVQSCYLHKPSCCYLIAMLHQISDKKAQVSTETQKWISVVKTSPEKLIFLILAPKEYNWKEWHPITFFIIEPKVYWMFLSEI